MTLRLHGREVERLDAEYPDIMSRTEEIKHSEIVLPESLYKDTRGFIEKLAEQINASYEYNIFDGCAVLMRRLIEILLILSYEFHKMEGLIKSADGRYKNLSNIVDDAERNPTLGLTPECRACLDDFRKIGNLSAHKIYYNCKRADLSHVLREYRLTVEELLYKAGIK